MNFNFVGKIGQMGVKSLSKAGFWASKHAPELCMVGGTISFGGALIFAGKGTLEAAEVLDEVNKNKAIVDAVKEHPDYTPEKQKKDKIVIAVTEAKGLAKAYAPAVGLSMLSLAFFFEAHHLIKGRNIALACAYSTLADSYKAYRGRVVEKYGEEEDYILSTGVVQETETITEIDEDGKKHKKKVKVDVLDGEPTGYQFIFDNEHTMANVSDPISARDKLMCAEKYANEILNTRGYITLNEVLRGLGMPETTAGAVVGWQSKGNGDGFVDFRMKQVRTRMDDGGVAFLLDFNVDGPIYQDIDKYNKRWGE